MTKNEGHQPDYQASFLRYTNGAGCVCATRSGCRIWTPTLAFFVADDSGGGNILVPSSMQTGRLPDADSLSQVRDISDKMGIRTSDEIPEQIAHQEDDKAYYGDVAVFIIRWFP